MRTPKPKLIGSTELWSARLYFSEQQKITALQAAVTGYVYQSGIPVVGYYIHHPASLTLLRWPETRAEYRSPTIPECNLALGELATRLQARSTQQNVIPSDRIHTMMGRKKNGYAQREVVPLSRLARNDLDNFTTMEGHMISARTVAKGEVEPYGEPVGILLAHPSHEAEIHQIGQDLEQWHYAIERGPAEVTDFYETPWASNQA